jgi:septum site-determining protein MinC
MAQPQIRMRGTRDGLAITLEEGEWHELLHELDTRFDQAPAFFRGSQVHLTTGNRDIGQAELQQFMDVLLKHEIQLASLRTVSGVSAQAAQALGVRLALPQVGGDQTETRAPVEEPSEGLLVRRTLRSGQLLQHLGHVVVIGDVNPGAEIIAGGDVVVWGRVLGMIHAGALGDNKAIVCALELRPTQLRIGSHIAISPPESEAPSPRPGRDSGTSPSGALVPRSGRAGPVVLRQGETRPTGRMAARLRADGKKEAEPEVAFVQDELIVAEPWSRR